MTLGYREIRKISGKDSYFLIDVVLGFAVVVS